MKRAQAAEESNASWLQYRLLWRIVALAFFIAMFIGTVMAWAFFFRSYDSVFDALTAEELNLAQQIYNESNARSLADIALEQQEAFINATLILDIATRQAQQDAINASLLEDIANRTSGDAALSAELAAEIAQRIANDTLITWEIGNATATLEVIQAFDLYSSVQFLIIENNITVIREEIYTEIAARVAAQAALTAADLIIDADLVLLINELNAEVAARIAQQNLINLKLHLITTSLLRTIDGQSPIADNMVFHSLSASLVIGNGVPSNQITLTQNALLTLAGVGADVTGNLAILGNSGLTVTFPSPNTVTIAYSGPVPPSPQNYARLVAVYPAVSSNSEVQGYHSLTLKNGFYGYNCAPDPAHCNALLGSQWGCSGGFNTPGFDHRCTNTECGGGDESQCFNLLGSPWHCRGGNCVLDYCTYDGDCTDVMGSNWYCQNYGCTQGVQTNLPYRPTYGSISYPFGPGIYQQIAQPYSSTSAHCAGCIFPQPGAFNNNAQASPPGYSAYPLVYGNRRPYDPISHYPFFQPAQYTQECIFDNSWEGQNCGFIMPASGTYVVQVTINLRAAVNQPGACAGRMWFYMHIDRSGGIPPNWEMVDSDYMAINNEANAPIGQVYITMSTTLTLSTATPSSTFTTPIAPGTFLYAGWSAFQDDPLDCSGNQYQYAAWYSITYDITQVA